MRTLVTNFVFSANKRPRRFEPTVAEVFDVDCLENKRFVAIAVGKVKGETGSFCRDCDFYLGSKCGKNLCEVGKVVCRSYERKDGRQIVIKEKKPFLWAQ